MILKCRSFCGDDLYEVNYVIEIFSIGMEGKIVSVNHISSEVYKYQFLIWYWGEG